MKLFLIAFFVFLSGCHIYTIHNQYKENIIADVVVLVPDQCVEFFDFPLIGDFPIKFRYKNNHLISKKSYPPAHYTISEQGEILKQEKACPIEIVGTGLTEQEQKEDEESGTGEKPEDQTENSESGTGKDLEDPSEKDLSEKQRENQNLLKEDKTPEVESQKRQKPPNKRAIEQIFEPIEI